MSDRLLNDVDPIETRDWLQAIESVIREEGVERAQYLIDQVLNSARQGGVNLPSATLAHNYVNSIARKMSQLIRETWSWSVVSVSRCVGTR
ncbi:Pyruvate dehydrogenase E1 component [Edwardsiella tarda]|nr:Pyruvate dehydrogenase E1 component [Edwardsiella tarda]